MHVGGPQAGGGIAARSRRGPSSRALRLSWTRLSGRSTTGTFCSPPRISRMDDSVCSRASELLLTYHRLMKRGSANSAVEQDEERAPKPRIAVSSLRVRNLLSFSEEGVEIDLLPLNVLIGPNGSGKSNLIEVIGLLKSTVEDLAEPFIDTGGVGEWIWKGNPKGSAAIDATVGLPFKSIEPDFLSKDRARRSNRVASILRIHYGLSFRLNNFQLEIIDERIEGLSSPLIHGPMPRVYFSYANGRPVLYTKGKRRLLRPEEINPQESVLHQRKDPDQFPELTELGRLFESFRFYRDWEFGIDARPRDPSPADGRTDFLEESLRNLGLMLSRLMANTDVKPNFLQYLRTFYRDAEDIRTPAMGGRIEIRLEERSKFSISSARLSDGTLRWLALLTILLHPTPPPLVCLEEPELGLHPDVIRPLAKLLVEASQRMQLVVTTHSDALVDELSETPESVIVCEKEAGATTLKRLNREELAPWLKQYTLGDLWHKGQIGGTRW